MVNKRLILIYSLIGLILFQSTNIFSEKKKSVSKKEILKIAKEAGTSKPEWWDSVNLNYPKTLDLKYNKPPKGSGWNTKKYIYHYYYSVVSANSNKYKEGTKFLHYGLTTKGANKDAYYYQLGHSYHDLLSDWARTIYWYNKCKKPDKISLAHAYWKLGSKSTAMSILKKMSVDTSRHGEVVKLWADMGMLSKAAMLAKRSARYSIYGGAYKALADGLRNHGKYKEALKYYEKVLKQPRAKHHPEVGEMVKTQTRECIKNIKIFKTFDIKKIKDGSYNSSAQGYSGKLKVDVVVASGKITKVAVTSHKEKRYYNSLVDIPEKIIDKQSIKKIDATTGATITAEAIINATAQALNQGRK